MKNILAFDLGASSGKLFLASVDGTAVSFKKIHRFANEAHTANGAFFWDILQIYAEMNAGIRKAIALTGDQIDSFAIDSYCNDFGLIGEDGTLLTQVRCYRDQRTARHENKIYAKMSKEELYKRTGNQNALFNTLMQLAAMREESQGFLLDHSHRLLFVPDLLLHFLTGREFTEYTLASVSQLYDFNKNDWNQEILDVFQIPRHLFAPIVQPGTPLGPTSPEYNQMAGTKGFPVTAVCEHDTASAYLSAPTVSRDSILINCGTWALIGMSLEHYVITPEGYTANLANEGSIPGHHRLLRNVMSSWFIQETQKYYKARGKDFTYAELDQLALASSPFLCFFDPDEDQFFEPHHIPLKIQSSCVRCCGYSPRDLGELIRCIYETLALKFRWTIEQLEKVTGKTAPMIHMMGGGSQAKLLCQFVADATGKKVIAGPVEATALGNIALQMTACGITSSLEASNDLLKTAYTITEYLPQDTELWEEQYRRFICAVYR